MDRTIVYGKEEPGNRKEFTLVKKFIEKVIPGIVIKLSLMVIQLYLDAHLHI